MIENVKILTKEYLDRVEIKIKKHETSYFFLILRSLYPICFL